MEKKNKADYKYICNTNSITKIVYEYISSNVHICISVPEVLSGTFLLTFH